MDVKTQALEIVLGLARREISRYADVNCANYEFGIEEDWHALCDVSQTISDLIGKEVSDQNLRNWVNGGYLRSRRKDVLEIHSTDVLKILKNNGRRPKLVD